MGLNSAFNWLRRVRSVAFVVLVNEQAFDTKRFTLIQVCCATEGNHEKYILALTNLRPVTLRYPARFVSLCCAGIQLVNTQCKADCGFIAEVLVKIPACGVGCVGK